MSCLSSCAPARAVAQRLRPPGSGCRPSVRRGSDAGEEVVDQVELELDPERFVTRPEGRRAWLRQGRRELRSSVTGSGRRSPVGASERIAEVKRRFDEELAFTHAANRCYEQIARRGRMRRRPAVAAAPPQPYVPPLVPEGKINTTDPDSGVMIQQGQPPMQGYNAQAAVTDRPDHRRR